MPTHMTSEYVRLSTLVVQPSELLLAPRRREEVAHPPCVGLRGVNSHKGDVLVDEGFAKIFGYDADDAEIGCNGYE